jgi:hypothetical protein
MAYIPNGNRATVTIDLAGITDCGGKAKCWWTSPSTGANTFIGTFDNLDSDAADLCVPGTCSARPESARTPSAENPTSCRPPSL